MIEVCYCRVMRAFRTLSTAARVVRALSGRSPHRTGPTPELVWGRESGPALRTPPGPAGTQQPSLCPRRPTIPRTLRPGAPSVIRRLGAVDQPGNPGPHKPSRRVECSETSADPKRAITGYSFKVWTIILPKENSMHDANQSYGLCSN